VTEQFGCETNQDGEFLLPPDTIGAALGVLASECLNQNRASQRQRSEAANAKVRQMADGLEQNLPPAPKI